MSKKDIKTYRAKLSEFKQLDQNPNKHTERGQYLLETGIENVGYMDSMVSSEDNVILSGNLRSEVAGEKLGDEIIVIETDGTVPIMHRRTDVKSTDERAKLAAISANRSEVDWEIAVIEQAEQAELFFWESELDDLRAQSEIEDEIEQQLAESGNTSDGRESLKPDTVVRALVKMSDVSLFEKAIQATGLRNRGDALREICEVYLLEKGQFDFAEEDSFAEVDFETD